MSKHFNVQFGDNKPEQVDQAGLDALKKAYGVSFSSFTVSEVAAPVDKPADITKTAAEAKSEAKKAKAE